MYRDDRAPIYNHDCNSCIFLGRYNGHDLYYCDQGTRPTVIARYGSIGEEYRSGLEAAQYDKELRMAKFLAIDERLVKEKKKMKLEIESEKVLEAAKKCPEWKEGLETLFPEAFEEEDKYFDFSKVEINFKPPLGMNLLDIGKISIGKYANKGIFLTGSFDWVLIREPRHFCLIPTKKE